MHRGDRAVDAAKRHVGTMHRVCGRHDGGFTNLFHTGSEYILQMMAFASFSVNHTLLRRDTDDRFSNASNVDLQIALLGFGSGFPVVPH